MKGRGVKLIPPGKNYSQNAQPRVTFKPLDGLMTINIVNNVDRISLVGSKQIYLQKNLNHLLLVLQLDIF